MSENDSVPKMVQQEILANFLKITPAAVHKDLHQLSVEQHCIFKTLVYEYLYTGFSAPHLLKHMHLQNQMLQT